MQSLSLRCVPLSAVVLAAACGGSSDSDLSGGSKKKGVPIEDVPALIAGAQCDAYDRCFGAVYDAFSGGESCRDRYRTAVEDELPRLKAAIDAGLFHYDGTLVQDCVDAIAKTACDDLLGRGPDVCDDAFDGTVEMGRECSNDDECKGDAYCKATGGMCPGECSPLEGAGGPCAKDEHCTPGLACSEDTDRCYQPAGKGDDCEGGSAPECEPHLFCMGKNEDTGTPGKCQTLDEAFSVKEGQPCNLAEGPICEGGLSCMVQSVDMTTGTIDATCVKTLAAGAACAVGGPDPCQNDEYCAVAPMSFEGTCTKKPKAGEPCATGPFEMKPSVCAPDTRCDDGTCRPFQKLGGSCKTDDVCYSDTCVKGACVSGSACR